MYQKEIYMYEKVFPQIYQLWPADSFTPVVYNTVPESGIIIMEDLLKVGFVSKKATAQLDFEHCKLAVQTLAEFHAVSFKYLRSKNPCDIPECMRHGSEMGPSFQAYVDSLFDKFLQTVSSLQHHSMIKKLTDFKASFWGNAKKMMSPDEEGVNVLIHGDFWTGNILFKYCDRKQVTSLKIVDWQISRIGCPVVDLIYFFAVSPQFEVFKNKREILIDLYLNKFNATLEILKCDFVYTKEELNNDMEKYKFLYVNMVSTALQIMLNSIGGVLDIEHTGNASKLYQLVLPKWLAYFEAENII